MANKRLILLARSTQRSRAGRKVKLFHGWNSRRGERINDIGKCNLCGICAEACPKKSLTQKQTYRKPVREFEIIFLQGEGEFKSKDSPGNADPGD